MKPLQLISEEKQKEIAKQIKLEYEAWMASQEDPSDDQYGICRAPDTESDNI
jgi:hypothetical protein